MPIATVIVTCFNQAHWLETAVGSVLAQTLPDLECLIVDDGSTDETRQVAAELAVQDARVRYLYKPNGGVSSARNLGLAQARGEWVQCLDGDDWLHPDKLRGQLEQARAKLDEAAPVAGESPYAHWVLYCDYERVRLGADHTHHQRQVHRVGPNTWDDLLERLLLPDFLADSPFPLLQDCLLMHQTVAARYRFNEALQELQDRFFCLELLAQNVRYVYTPLVGAGYTRHAANRTNDWPRLREYYRVFYQAIAQAYPDWLPLARRGIVALIDDAIRSRDPQRFEQLMVLAQYPVGVFGDRLTLSGEASLRLAYAVSTLIPAGWLYPRKRGPRLAAVWAALTGGWSRRG